jgi:hypothetical protein
MYHVHSDKNPLILIVLFYIPLSWIIVSASFVPLLRAEMTHIQIVRGQETIRAEISVASPSGLP